MNQIKSAWVSSYLEGCTLIHLARLNKDTKPVPALVTTLRAVISILLEYQNSGVKNPTNRVTNSGLDVFKFCKYCWRQPAPGRNICPHHATHSSKYLESYRVKQLFDSYTYNRSSVESFEFLDDDFCLSYFLPTNQIYSWLLKRRPYVADRLKSAGLPSNDKNIVRSLLKMLQPTQGYHWSALEASRGVNEWITSHPELIWPMLLRAETWFELRNQASNNWGGKKSRGKKTQKEHVLPPVLLADKWIM